MIERAFRNDAKRIGDDAEIRWILVDKRGRRHRARKRERLPKRLSIELKEGGCSIKNGVPCIPEFCEEPRPRKRNKRGDRNVKI
ncbi:MAG: hypothetical protein QXX08_05680 [Candidatus Bathyarchaeia archaeon]